MPRARRLTDRIVALDGQGLMLSALELARRIEAGELTPRAVVDLCAQAIAAKETEIGAFTALDIDARAAHGRRARSDCRCAACRSA